MTRNRSCTRLVLAILALLLASGSASAGLDRDGTVRVHVNWAAGQAWATGAVTDARRTGSRHQSIGCSIHNVYGIRCSARTSDGERLACRTENPSVAMIAAVSAVNPASRIDFYPEVGTSRCLTIYVRNDSGNL